jgi:hypothetical protein
MHCVQGRLRNHSTDAAIQAESGDRQQRLQQCIAPGRVAHRSNRRRGHARPCMHTRTVLYCTVLYCTVLYCAILYCTVLCYTVLYCAILYCTVLCYTVLCYTVLYCTSQTHAPEAQTLLYPIGHLPGLRKSGTHQVRLPQPLFSLDTACRTLLLLLLPPDVLSDPRQRAGSRRRRTDHSDPN